MWITCHPLVVVYFIVCLTDEQYEYIINGTAQAEIQQFMSVDHSADEYAEVSQRYPVATFLGQVACTQCTGVACCYRCRT